MSKRTIAVRRTIAADVPTVWDALADLAAHVEWMADAERIRFTSATTEGVGTTFDCDTKVGPFRLRDHMEVTAWEPERSITVRHAGVVTGEGTFRLSPSPKGTSLRWEETLRFPWWIPGGPAAFVLRRIWRRNLRRFEGTLGTGTTRRTRRRARRGAAPRGGPGAAVRAGRAAPPRGRRRRRAR